MPNKILIQHFDQKCHPFMASNITEDFLPLQGEIFIVALGHHLEASLDEGSPRVVSGGLSLAHLVSQTSSQGYGSLDHLPGNTHTSGIRVNSQHLQIKSSFNIFLVEYFSPLYL